MSTTVDQEIEARVAQQLQTLAQQASDPVYQLDQIRALFSRIHAGEVEYGVPWQDAHAAVRSGKIYETFEVCTWLFDIDLLQDMIAES